MDASDGWVALLVAPETTGPAPHHPTRAVVVVMCLHVPPLSPLHPPRGGAPPPPPTHPPTKQTQLNWMNNPVPADQITGGMCNQAPSPPPPSPSPPLSMPREGINITMTLAGGWPGGRGGAGWGGLHLLLCSVCAAVRAAALHQ